MQLIYHIQKRPKYSRICGCQEEDCHWKKFIPELESTKLNQVQKEISLQQDLGDTVSKSLNQSLKIDEHQTHLISLRVQNSIKK